MGRLALKSKHRLLCGDCTRADDVAEVWAGDSPVVTITDPPYGIGYKYGQHDDSDNARNASLVADAFALAPAAKIWSPGLNNLARDIARFGLAKVLVWNKKFAQRGSGLGGASTWEPILVAGHPPAAALRNDVLEYPTDRAQVNGVDLRELHPCPKPVGLYAELICAFTVTGDAIHEPFCGSGTTLIASEQNTRRCLAIEIDPAYVDVAATRWANFTKQEPILESTGETFSQVKARREAERAAEPVTAEAIPGE